MTYCENEFLFDQSITLKLHDQPQYFNAELINMLRISRYSDNFKIDPIIDEKLDVANRFIDYHTKAFGFEKANVEFRLGKIEQLTDDSGMKTNSFDVIVSNCVVNLTPDKKKVLQQVYEMLKPGGEFYFSDMYADRPIPKELHSNKILWGKSILRSFFVIDRYIEIISFFL
ncbi:unnamed protein product [Rotaria sp. Silwood1]|nr:unnamed protein product [Rotaria sp. Silwood1]